MRRRAFITLVGGAAATWPIAARGQQSKVARIGALYIGTADAESFKNELREGLRELGYVEGQNIAFEFRSAEGKLDRLPELAAELVRLKVDVIVALYVPCALAAKHNPGYPNRDNSGRPSRNRHSSQLGASWRKHHRRVFDVFRIRWEMR